MSFDRISTYTKKELGNFTNNEIKQLVQFELNFDSDNEKLKQIIVDIENGNYVNPYKPVKFNPFIPVASLMVGWTLMANIIPGLPTVPVLSDITPVISEARYLNGDTETRVVSHRQLNQGFTFR